jgi:formate-dependent nitrite reductase membrane component NrfD
MQACPYDALYIDPDRNTAAKCNFDASRIEMGYKPACEVVCPTRAILSGDLDDPKSAISRRIAMEKVSVRKPEKGTKPKLFYAGVDGDLVQPTMSEPQTSHFWAEKLPGEDLYALKNGKADRSTPGSAREVYDVPHGTPWGKKIASYLWTKSIAAGVLLVAALLLNMGFQHEVLTLHLASPVLALAFLAITMVLLIVDLKRPGRFFYILTRPNFRSWLVLGGYILFAYGVLTSLWLIHGLTEDSVGPWVFWPTALLALASAGYSAFLFGQAKGRDLWQSPLLFWHLITHAFAAGSATLLLISPLTQANVEVFLLLGQFLAISLLLMLAIIIGELMLPHGSEELLRATALLTRGALRKQFWILVVGVGMILPLALIFWPIHLFSYLGAAILTLTGLWCYENLWIKAGQAVPLS